MRSMMSSKLEMAERVRSFSVANPSTDPGYPGMVTRLEAGLARASALLAQELNGVNAYHAGTRYRVGLRRRIQRTLLRHLVRIGELAAAENPALAESFKLPTARLGSLAFRSAVGTMLTQARAEEARLLALGMSPTLLGDLTAGLAEYDDAIGRASGGRRSHVGAHAELKAVATELMKAVEVLNGFNRYRFRDDPERQAAWESARNLIVRTRSRPAEGTTPQPSASEVRPAA